MFDWGLNMLLLSTAAKVCENITIKDIVQGSA